ncbi:MAG: hypothetical protein AABY07_04155, partial [Nanoarchaeota archaeon]
PILIVILLAALAVGGYFVYRNQYKSNSTLESSILTYAECSQAKNNKISQTFPRQCEISDGKTYIEEVAEPIDTNNWTTFN